MLGLGNFPDAFFVFQDIARTDVHAADLHDGKSLAGKDASKFAVCGRP
jgi:hypothetical protein